MVKRENLISPGLRSTQTGDMCCTATRGAKNDNETLPLTSSLTCAQRSLKLGADRNRQEGVSCQ